MTYLTYFAIFIFALLGIIAAAAAMFALWLLGEELIGNWKWKRYCRYNESKTVCVWPKYASYYSSIYCDTSYTYNYSTLSAKLYLIPYRHIYKLAVF